jgi:hypothetical protein
MTMIDDLSAFLTLLLGVSLATERLVAVAKTSFPIWLADEKKTAALETDLIGDRWRRLRVQLVAFIAAWVISGSLADWNFFGPVNVAAAGAIALPAPLLALLSMGGSALWTSLLGYASAAKDVRAQDRAKGGLAFRAEARRQGVTALDAGIAAISRGGTVDAPSLADALARLGTLEPPPFDAPSRVVSNA